MIDHTSDYLTFGGSGSMVLVGMAEPSMAMGVIGGLATVLGLGMKVYELFLKHRDYDGRIHKLERMLAERDAWIKTESDRQHQPIPRMEQDQ